jgi:hypothetical protein
LSEREDDRDLFTQAVEAAILEDQLCIAIVTSRTQASFESKGVPYGAGKTTLAMREAYHFLRLDPVTKRYFDTALDQKVLANWDPVFANMWYYPSKILKSVEQARLSRTRISIGIWDDTQYSAGAQSGLPPALRDLVGDITTERPELGLLIMTAPSINDIHAVLRPLIQFELIVHRRGYFEVQKVKHRKNFANPKKDFVKLDYVSGQDPSEQDEPDFDPLPAAVQTKYDEWRAEQKGMRRGRIISALERYERTVQKTVDAPTIGAKNQW